MVKPLDKVVCVQVSVCLCVFICVRVYVGIGEVGCGGVWLDVGLDMGVGVRKIYHAGD